MKSPFPAMDPYLEAHWGDVHASLMVYICDALEPGLPEAYVARINSRELPTTVSGDEQLPERHVEILDTTSGDRVVTAIEVLSPTNKLPYEGRQAYRRKQREYLGGGVNLVEIDLIRDGPYVLAAPLEAIPASQRTPYLICVRRVTRPQQAEIYRAPLRERLPTIPIPLRATDRDAVLDLQSLLDHCYRAGRYDRTDYRRHLEPPLSADAAAWAEALLREKGLH